MDFIEQERILIETLEQLLDMENDVPWGVKTAFVRVCIGIYYSYQSEPNKNYCIYEKDGKFSVKARWWDQELVFNDGDKSLLMDTLDLIKLGFLEIK